MHVYRGSANSKQPALEASTSSAPVSDIIEDQEDVDGIMLAVLAVPSWMTPSDFLAFVAPAAEGMAHLRMIRYEFPVSLS